jgi:hypothetical protein
VSRINLRLIFGLSSALIALAIYFALSAGSASAHPGHDGSVHHDVAAQQEMTCDEATGFCSHGPDPAPPGVTPAEADAPVQFSSAANKAVCDGNGTSGRRVQVIYARASNLTDRYSQYLDSFRTWAADADAIYQKSAEKTGGERYIRFVHDSNCTISVLNEVLPAGNHDFNSTWQHLYYNRGYTDDSRKYLVFLDSGSDWYCGQGHLYDDDIPGSTNANNNYLGFSVVFNGCWADGLTTAHELGHNFGSVQKTAPHASGSGFWHCTDDYDVMCYADGAGLPMTFTCGNYSVDEFILDCGNDDYFHTNPPTGNYLKTHWNIANSGWLGTSLPETTTITLDKEKSKYNGWVTATLDGFAPNSTVTLRWPREYEKTAGVFTRTLATVTTSGAGAATISFRTPLEPLGDYTVSARDSDGTTATTTLRVIPRIMLAPEYEGPTGFRFRVYFYGYAPGDRVEVQWYEGAGYDVLKTITVADNGRASTILYVPDDASTGDHLIRGKVVGVSRSTTTTFTVTGPGAADEPTETPTPEPTATATPEPTVTPEPTATLEPTPEPTVEVPTETPTPEPTEELPTETPTPESEEPAPTETPTPEPTATPEATGEGDLARLIWRRAA